MSNSVLVVLGMHRSGTSLVAQWLDANGLNLGDRILGAGIGNSEGHLEDLDFHDLHEQIFRENSIGYGGLEGIGDLEISRYFKARMRSAVEMKNQLRAVWGWKEPRTCLFADDYAELLGDSASYLIVYRGLDQVVDSLVRRDRKLASTKLAKRHYLVRLAKKLSSFQQANPNPPLDRYAESWICYNERILGFLDKGYPCYCVSLEDLVSDDRGALDWLNGRSLGLRNVSISEIYQPRLLNSEREPLAISSRLRKRAEAIEKEFEKYRSPVHS